MCKGLPLKDYLGLSKESVTYIHAFGWKVLCHWKAVTLSVLWPKKFLLISLAYYLEWQLCIYGHAILYGEQKLYVFGVPIKDWQQGH